MNGARSRWAADGDRPCTRRAGFDSRPSPRVAREEGSRGRDPRLAGRTRLPVSTKHALFSLCLYLCFCSCASLAGTGPTPAQANPDPQKAHELTLEALDVIETDPTRAERLLDAALRADPFHGPAHNNLGVLYLRQSRLYEAANEFEQARKLLPGNPDPRLNLGLTLERAGLYERAFEAYDAALEVSPAHIRTIQAIARLTLRTGGRNDRLLGLLEDVSLRGETLAWRSWAQEQMSRLKR